MEEFKIITLPHKEKEEVNEKIELSDSNVENYNPPKKRYIFIFFLILLIIISIIVIRVVTTYEDYEVEQSWERQDSSGSYYISYNNNLLKYSADGVSYTGFDGSLIWSYTYDMTNPSTDICEDYIVVYDKKGTEVDIFSSKGFINSITTTTPIIEAKIASQGTVALMLQEGTTSYIQMYDTTGTMLVSGEIHPENTGFPVSMALSSDATRLLLSVINIDNGEVSTKLIFYDFTSAGKEEEDNIVASYQYLGVLIPKVNYMKNNKAIAFSDSKIIIFNNNIKATVTKEIVVGNEMKSIFYNDTHFGYVCEVALDSGEVVNELNVYNLYGFRNISKEIESSYEEITLLDNNEVFIQNDNEVILYNLQGFKRFDYSFEDTIYAMIPATTSRRYYIIEESKTEEIYLK